MQPPRIAITLGDVAGIGPEVAVRALANAAIREIGRFCLIGDPVIVTRAVEVASVELAVVSCASIATAIDASSADAIGVWNPARNSLTEVRVGAISGVAGRAAYDWLVAATDAALLSEIDAIVTAPLNKAAMQAGGHKWPGHTELLAHEFGVANYSLVLSAGDLYFFHLTAHVSLAQAIENCTPQRTDDVLSLAAAFTRALGQPDQAIGLAGLNPHAGENRIFGDQDADILQPAVARARERGINAHGPIPADALIPAAVRGKWNIVVVCYHDQGHAPFKAVYGDEGVNITIGLPVVRVSVDHGTAFDIAGKGKAREASLVLSCQRAAQLAPGWDAVWQIARRSSVVSA